MIKRLFNTFFRANNNITALQRVDLSSSSFSVENLKIRINNLDQQIAEINRTIIQAQIVRVRSVFSSNQNFLGGFQKKIVESSASQSISWHQSRLLEIINERRNLQDQLDKLTGQFMKKKLRRLFFNFGIALIFTSLIVVLILGFFAVIYALPLIIIIVLSFWFITNFKSKKINR